MRRLEDASTGKLSVPHVHKPRHAGPAENTRCAYNSSMRVGNHEFQHLESQPHFHAKTMLFVKFYHQAVEVQVEFSFLKETLAVKCTAGLIKKSILLGGLCKGSPMLSMRKIL